MTRMIVRAAVMWQISVALHTKEGKHRFSDEAGRKETQSCDISVRLPVGTRLAGQRYWQYFPLLPWSHS